MGKYRGRIDVDNKNERSFVSLSETYLPILTEWDLIELGEGLNEAQIDGRAQLLSREITMGSAFLYGMEDPLAASSPHPPSLNQTRHSNNSSASQD